MATTTEIIAKEGWKLISIALLGVVLMWLLDFDFLGFLCLVVLICLVYCYRNLERIAEDIADDCVLAPLDGMIQNIQNKTDGIYIEIKKPICFCGMLRMPIAKIGDYGEVKEIEHVNGLKNGNYISGERIKIAFKPDYNKDIKLHLTLYPRYFSQIVLYLWDTNFKLGERLGFFLSGNAIFEIPLKSELKVNIGDKIYAGQTLLAKICT